VIEASRRKLSPSFAEALVFSNQSLGLFVEVATLCGPLWLRNRRRGNYDYRYE
jgi:hypothetical protein